MLNLLFFCLLGLDTILLSRHDVDNFYLTEVFLLLFTSWTLTVHCAGNAKSLRIILFIIVGIKTAVQTDYRLYKTQYFKEGTFFKTNNDDITVRGLLQDHRNLKQDMNFSLQ
jgi:hypothetical protein